MNSVSAREGGGEFKQKFSKYSNARGTGGGGGGVEASTALVHYRHRNIFSQHNAKLK